jgi:non-lysosomal glucosylceramidase
MSTTQDWTIPACAWRRELGNIPTQAKNVQFQGHIYDTENRPKKGIPLGGIGSGSLMYNLCGSFGPFYMKAGRYEERFLSQAAFHVYEQFGERPAVVKTLATDDVLPAWNRLQVGEAVYSALFPRGWCTYNTFHADLSLQFFSPVIKDNYRETSFPVAVFLFRVANPLNTPITVSVMLTFPNAPYTGPHHLNLDAEPKYAAQFDAMVAGHLRARTGLHNRVAADNAITALLMEAHSQENPPETEGTQWCIAAPSGATYIPNWDGAGDGSDIWQVFAERGELINQALPAETTLPSGALAQSITLAPGEEEVLPFVLAWDFPYEEFSSGTRWQRRYTEYFQTQPDRALNIAREALTDWAQWLADVQNWTNPIVDNPVYPDWLKQGALNELYYQVFGGSFWENGCVTKPKCFGGRAGQHLAFVMECQEYPFAETLDVRHHAARVTRDLWPHMERDILLVYADFIMDTADGSAPHDAGSPHGDPFFVYDAYRQSQIAFTDPNWFVDEAPTRQTTAWSEFSPKFIQQCYAYWHRTGDNAFLDAVWDAIVRTFHYHVSTDTDGDGITEMMSSEYVDNKFFNAVLWLGTMPMLMAMADHRNDSHLCQIAADQLERARATTEHLFWNPTLGYYQFNAQSETVMGDALLGQRYAEVTGFPPVLDPERMTSHYRQVFRIASLLTDLDGDGIGNMGMGNVLTNEGKSGGVANISRHDSEVWIGVTYVLAASMYHWGKQINDGAMQACALMLAWGVYQQTWCNEATGFWFNTPEAWDIADPTIARAPLYQRARAIWELLMELDDPFGKTQ